MNNMLMTVFGLQLLIIIVFSSLSLKWMDVNNVLLTYLPLRGKVDNYALAFVIQFLTYWVAYSHMIPISLYVFVELLKILQSKLINQDVRMFFAEDMSYANCRTSDLIEELGQVEFVFSDKTGTLTQNKMEFKKCQAAGLVWGDLTQEEITSGKPFFGMCESSVVKLKDCLKHHL